jgi:DNA-directed RNA polymerase specialized sigma24 family protein
MARSITPEDLLAHAGWLRALARRLAGDPDLAEDLVQETFLTAVERQPLARQAAGSWLGAVLRNFAYRAHHQSRRRQRRERLAARPQWACISAAHGDGFRNPSGVSRTHEHPSLACDQPCTLEGDRGAAQTTAELTRFLTHKTLFASLPDSDDELFCFEDPRAWTQLYDATVIFTMGSYGAAMNRACDLASAAVRLQVALGRADWSACPEAFEEAPVELINAVARAQAEAGDAVGGVSWAREIADLGNRAWAIVGLADGILEKRGKLVRQQWR